MKTKLIPIGLMLFSSLAFANIKLVDGVITAADCENKVKCVVSFSGDSLDETQTVLFKNQQALMDYRFKPASLIDEKILFTYDDQKSEIIGWGQSK